MEHWDHKLPTVGLILNADTSANENLSNSNLLNIYILHMITVISNSDSEQSIPYLKTRVNNYCQPSIYTYKFLTINLPIVQFKTEVFDFIWHLQAITCQKQEFHTLLG